MAFALLLGGLACGAGVRRDPLGRPAGDAAIEDGSLDAGPADTGDSRDTIGRDSAEVDAPQALPDAVEEVGPSGDAPVIEAGLPIGADCIDDRDCVFGHCVDGRCCDSSCGLPCLACNLPGSIGRCVAVPAGPDEACSGSQSCNGAGLCQGAPGASCATHQQCASGICAGLRCCRFQCQEGETCDGVGNCRLADGSTCTSRLNCASSYCVDGRCCSVDSCNTGECEFCRGPAGACTILSTEAPDGVCGVRTACDENRVCTRTTGTRCTSPGDCLSLKCRSNICSCELCFFPEMLDFGTIRLRAGTKATFTVKNRGAVARTIASVTGLGPFVASGTCMSGIALPPAGACTLELAFDPDDPGSFTTTVELVLSPASGPGPRLSLHAAAADDIAPVLTPTPADFGDVPGGRAQIEFVLQNPSRGQTVDVRPELVGPGRGSFEVQSSTCPGRLLPGQQCNVSVAYRSNAQGLEVATLVVAGATAGLRGLAD